MEGVYDELDEVVIKAIRDGNRAPAYDHAVREAANRIVAQHQPGREWIRVVDGRLQSLRRAGRIAHRVKRKDGRSGWEVV